jgi:H+/Cl- antiporter ClcA
MSEWTPFFLGMSAASATLAGLLFVGIQFNIDTLVTNPGSRWYAVARSTFSTYTMLLLVPLVLVIPTTTLSTIATVLAIAGVLGAAGAVRTWLPVWKSILRRQERLWQSFWLLFSPLFVYALLTWNGLLLFGSSDPRPILLTISYDLIILFAIALRNSWRILVEVTLERRTAKAAQLEAQKQG